MSATRDTFLGILPNLPHQSADAMAVFCGEDCAPRLQRCAMLLGLGAAPTILLLGGRDEPPRITSAAKAAIDLMELGVAPNVIAIETESTNTADQARALVRHAREKAWRRVILVASSYHIPRAFLTVVQALADADALTEVHVIPAPTNQAPWFRAPEAMPETRAALLLNEYKKIETYRRAGDCATWDEGIEYLRRWESPT